MPLPQTIIGPIQNAKTSALYAIGDEFNRATQRVMERAHANGTFGSSGVQGLAAVECLHVAEARLRKLITDVQRILGAVKHAPSEAEQIELTALYAEVTETLVRLVKERAAVGSQTAGMIGRGNVIRALFPELDKVKRECLNEFAIVLLECGKNENQSGTTITYNLSGHNARINNGSVDMSTNSVASNGPELFEALQKLIKGIPDEPSRRTLLQDCENLQKSKDHATRSDIYLGFVQHAANHMTLLAPLLPALAHWIQNLG